MSRLVSYFSLTLLFTLCACFDDYAFVIVVIKESYYYYYYYYYGGYYGGWWRGTVVERRSLAGELSLSCA